jgi:hypothetical protein
MADFLLLGSTLRSKTHIFPIDIPWLPRGDKNSCSGTGGVSERSGPTGKRDENPEKVADPYRQERKARLDTSTGRQNDKKLL